MNSGRQESCRLAVRVSPPRDASVTTKSGRQESCRQEEEHWQAEQDGWRYDAVQYARPIAEVIERITGDLDDAGYSSKDRFAVCLALEEALVNAVKHGNQGDPRKEVRVRYHLTAERLLVEIQDEGAGFDPADVPDPLEPENMERTCGRGLFLMRTYMTWVKYNDHGNCVMMCKQRSA